MDTNRPLWRQIAAGKCRPAIVLAAAATLTALFVFARWSQVATAAPNLVTNGDFATNDAAWTALASSTHTWTNTQDADGLNPASGAERVDYTGVIAGTAVVESGCIALTGAAAYPFSGKVKSVSTNGVGVLARISIVTYTDASCLTASATQDSNVVLIGLGDPVGWQTLSGSITASALQQHSKVQLKVVGPAATTAAAFWDNITLANNALDTPTATTTNTPAPS